MLAWMALYILLMVWLVVPAGSMESVLLVVHDGTHPRAGTCDQAERVTDSDPTRDHHSRPRARDVLQEFSILINEVLGGLPDPAISLSLHAAGCDVTAAEIIGNITMKMLSATVAGVVTMVADSSLVQQVAVFLDYFHVPLVEVVQGGTIIGKSSGRNHFILPHFSYWHMQTAFSLAQAYSWTALTMLDTDPNYLRASTRKAVFSRLAADQGVCLLPAFSRNDLPTVVVVFGEPNPSLLQTIAGTLVVVGGLEEESQSRFLFQSRNGTTFFISEGRTGQLGVVELIQEACSSMDTSHENTTNNVTANNTLCLIRESLAWFDDDTFAYSFITSVKLLLRIVNISVDFCEKQGRHPNISSICKLLQNNSAHINEETNVVWTSGMTFTVQQFSVNSSSESKDYRLLTKAEYSVFIPRSIPSEIKQTTCGSMCDRCLQCFPLELSPKKLITTRQNSDVFVVGIFPIHRSSRRGYCDLPNPEGHSAAVSFLETVRSRHSFNNRSLVGGVVFDSCASINEGIQVIHSLENCLFYYTEDVANSKVRTALAPSLIAAYIIADEELYSVPHVTDKIVMKIQKLGFSPDSDFSRNFADSVLNFLSAIGWTVINLVVSDQELFQNLAQLLETPSLSTRICFVNKITISSQTKNSDLFKRLEEAANQTSAFFLLTSLEDSNKIVSGLLASGSMPVKISLVLTPWNQQTDITNASSSVVDTVIKIRPAIKWTTNEMEKHSDPVPPLPFLTPWSSEFNSTHSTSAAHTSGPTSTDLTYLPFVRQATKSVLDLVEDADYLSKWPQQESEVTAKQALSYQGLEIFALFVDSNVTSEIATINNQHLVLKEFFSGPSFNTCRSWCPSCQSCPLGSSPRPQNSLQLPGDILLTGLFPLHRAGKTLFSCGSPQDDRDKILQVQAFMFALETVKPRYPYILPGVAVGGLVLDTCSSLTTSFKVLAEFQTCAANPSFPQRDDRHRESTVYDFKVLNPNQNVAYIIDAESENATSFVLDAEKLTNSLFLDSSRRAARVRDENEQLTRAIANILATLLLKKVLLVNEKEPEFVELTTMLVSEVSLNKVCVVTSLELGSSSNVLVSTMDKFLDLPIVLVARRETSLALFQSIKETATSYFWIIPVIHESWGDFQHSLDSIPVGSVIIDKQSKVNAEFVAFVQNSSQGSGYTSNHSSWFDDLKFLTCGQKEGQSLDVTHCPLISDTTTVPLSAHTIVQTVDALLHVVHSEYLRLCPLRSGICDRLASDMVTGRLSALTDVTFQYQGEELNFSFNRTTTAVLSLFSSQPGELVKVGSYSTTKLVLDVSKIGQLPATHSHASRFSCDNHCTCLELTPFSNRSFHDSPASRPATILDSSGEFLVEIWAIAVLTIGCIGAFFSLTFAAYVVYKVSRRALGKRYVGLGLTLLMSLTLLFLAVLPFVFTPCEVICGMRYLLPGFAFTLCFATIMVKLMSLRSYKLLGLGGEVSQVNQFLTAFFIVSVQVVLAVQWWINTDHSVLIETDSSTNQIRLSCHFNQRDFVSYHVFVLFLILLCCGYALGVRKEKKNMEEAKLLLACSWTCAAVWLVWLPCFFLLDASWSDFIVCVATLACAWAGLVIIFIPKIRMVSRLKYDVSHKVVVRGGHSVDTDFLYERPYSLPGSLTSTFSSSIKTNSQKTSTNLEAADVNY